ncbi:MAG: hypothetical protein IJ083_06255 [Clostridia bacterium]|nr:hypothetical protein [Clostridia bacterium]
MNLKEAFRYQNRLQSLMDEARTILNTEDNVTVQKVTVMKKQVMPDAENETRIQEVPSQYADRINDVVGFLVWLLSEHEKLTQSIRRTKNALKIDMDGEISLNRQRQEIASVLRGMTALRNSERTVIGGGRGYRFNAEGNQVTYVCDLQKVTTINFDRKMVRNTAAELERRSDAVSQAIDECAINHQVDYNCLFDVNDGFDEVFEVYMEQKK